MILEFKDRSQLEVKAIFGGPRLINGELRDTLRIEVDPNVSGFIELRDLFRLNENTDELYTYCNPSDDGEYVRERTKIGEGYNIFVSITDEERLIAPPPGQLQPKQFEEVYIVTMAQMTYLEHEENPGPIDGSGNTDNSNSCLCDYITKDEIQEAWDKTNKGVE